MHALFFGLKRAYWGTVAKSRKLLRLHSPHLTAARFDLMHAVRGWKFGVKQTALRERLGVCRPVLTRMLKSLVELGWLTRERCTGDRRTYWIEITEKGLQIIEGAYRRLVRSMRAARWVNQALVGRERWPDKDRSFPRMQTIEWLLDKVRTFFNAGGGLYYPWHPDD